jgi:hypothetical protein
MMDELEEDMQNRINEMKLKIIKQLETDEPKIGASAMMGILIVTAQDQGVKLKDWMNDQLKAWEYYEDEIKKINE